MSGPPESAGEYTDARDPGKTNFGDDADLNPPSKPMTVDDPIYEFPAKFNELSSRVLKNSADLIKLNTHGQQQTLIINANFEKLKSDYAHLKLFNFCLLGYSLLLLTVIIWKS